MFHAGSNGGGYVEHPWNELFTKFGSLLLLFVEITE